MRIQLEATMAQLTELQLNTLCQVRIRLQAGFGRECNAGTGWPVGYDVFILCQATWLHSAGSTSPMSSTLSSETNSWLTRLYPLRSVLGLGTDIPTARD